MSAIVKNLVVMALMLLVASVAWVMRPAVLIADQRPTVNLELLIPKQFGEWHELHQSTSLIVNPQQTALLDKIYSQTLSRSYVSAEGAVVMLSIAYGVNQSRDVALHFPDACYPAQGFEVLSNVKGTLETGFGNIRVTRMTARLGNRSEPVTYWSTLGDEIVQGGLETRLMRVQYGLRGQIPDGLIFRISSISPDARTAYEFQEAFVRTLIAAIPQPSRTQLIGKITTKLLQ